ncbi:MAG: DUF6465 family protein [Bacteroidales bacterium]|nr:DUF6465 family protein [Lachnoclostridium sp.]MCM1383222.1 DUF6465 family protein [Lachnoclostridium sp.]MCM1464553.1 DUF6465 family protein [Bacteroidales bacterium]
MAVTKKTIATTPVAATKAEASKEAAKAVTQATPVKTVKEEASAKKETAVKKTPGRKPGSKKADTAKKTETAKKAPAKKAEMQTDLHIQYSGKSYSQDELMKIAKDVWKYDLKQKVSALNSIKLYVKPEENVAYYVMNDEFTGHFNI